MFPKCVPKTKKMKNATAQIHIRSDFERKDGTFPIYYLRVTIDRKTKKIPLGITVSLKYWDIKHLEGKRGDVQHLKKNLARDKELARVQEIVLNHKIEGKTLTLERFDEHFKGISTNLKNSFFELAFSEIENDYAHKGSYETYRTRKSTIKAVKDYFNKDFPFDYIDYNALKRLDDHLKKEVIANRPGRGF